MTAITDILVNSQLSELSDSSKLQLSTNQKSQISSSSISFEEMLSSFRSEKPEEPKKLSSDDEYSKNKVEDSADKKVEDKQDSSAKTEKTETEDKTENLNEQKNVSEEKDASKTENTQGKEDKLALNQDTEKNADIKNEISDLKNLPVNQTENAEKNAKSKLSKDSKLANDFARMNEFLNEETLGETALIQQAGEVAGLENAKVNFQDVREKLEATDKEVALNLDEKLSGDELNLNRDVLNENPKVSKFDKEGKITVQDFRTELSEAQNESKDNGPKLKTEVHFDNNNTATITMDVANNAQNDVLSLNSQTAASDGSNFQAMLNNQIQAQAPELVKTGSIILKDNDKGTINLVLHPDDLGNVKIHLSMDGKTVHGHITVNSKEALQVFKDNAETLREAFIKNGFDAANFDVAFNNQSSGQNQEFNQSFNESQFIGKKAYGDLGGAGDVDSGFERNLQENENFSNYSINIVA